jgi:hypothetical protein
LGAAFLVEIQPVSSRLDVGNAENATRPEEENKNENVDLGRVPSKMLLAKKRRPIKTFHSVLIVKKNEMSGKIWGNYIYGLTAIKDDRH